MEPTKSTPPPIPQSAAAPVIPYATPVFDHRPPVDPRLRFIGRLCIWLGVIFAVLGSICGLVCLVVIANERDISTEDVIFWGGMLLCSAAALVGAITLLVAAKSSRKGSLLAAKIGAGSLLLAVIGAAILHAYSMSLTGRYDTALAVLILLGFAGVAVRLLVACNAYERSEKGVKAL